MAFGYSLSMRVTVLFFGVLKEMLASESQTLDLPQGATVDAVLGHFRELMPRQPKLWSTLAVAVNQSYAPSSCLLRDGDEVALLPPVSGGCAPTVALVTEPIDSESLVKDIKQGEDGAVVIFDGIVRNNTRGRRTLCLVYEAYPEMALRQMHLAQRHLRVSLVDQAKSAPASGVIADDAVKDHHSAVLALLNVFYQRL